MDITTDRLRLVHVPPEWLPSLLNADGLRDAIAAEVPPDWPPEHIDDGIVQFLRSKCIDGRLDPWWMRLIVTRSPRPELVGTCGYKGPPDEEGSVEIGYSIVASKQNLGYATEAAAGLIAHAFEDDRVHLIRAETLPSLRPSIRVLEKCGFQVSGRRDEAELGEPVLMFELRDMPIK